MANLVWKEKESNKKGIAAENKMWIIVITRTKVNLCLTRVILYFRAFHGP